MALNQKRAWLIAYDIRDHRRLARVHRFLKGCAVPLQYSVFGTQASPARIGKLAQELEQFIEPACDDVRIYAVPQPAHITMIGKRVLPEEASLFFGDEIETGLFSATPKKE